MSRTDDALDNPINWSFRIGRLFGIDIRVHVAFVICAVVLVWMQMPDKDAVVRPSLLRVLIDTLGIYAILFSVVLIHEFGHCFGARYTGGEADEILIWPLGGLAMTNPPHNAVAHMITTLAGPAVNVVICMICTPVLVLWTGSLGGVPWNPLHLGPIDSSIFPTTGQEWLMNVFSISYVLLLINMLPIFPFDGGRVLQAWLWPRKGYKSSMLIATFTGMVGAVAVGLVGLFLEQGWLLLMIAAFGYLTCYQHRRVIKLEDDYAINELGYDFSRGYTSIDRAGDTATRGPGFFERRRRRKLEAEAERERRQREEDERAIEGVLAKISKSGMDSLTPKERRILEQATERQRTPPE